MILKLELASLPRVRGAGGVKFGSWLGRGSGRDGEERSGAWYWPRQETGLRPLQVACGRQDSFPKGSMRETGLRSLQVACGRQDSVP